RGEELRAVGAPGGPELEEDGLLPDPLPQIHRVPVEVMHRDDRRLVADGDPRLRLRRPCPEEPGQGEDQNAPGGTRPMLGHRISPVGELAASTATSASGWPRACAWSGGKTHPAGGILMPHGEWWGRPKPRGRG